MRLPGEDDLRDSIRADFASELRVASDLLGLGTGIFRNSVRANANEAPDTLELVICLGLVAKACRQYRGIVALAEISLGDMAESLGRMLLETMLTTEFLMRETVTLKRDRKPLPDVPGYPLTRLFRSRLYLAHDAASMLKTLRCMATSYDLKGADVAHQLQLGRIAREIATKR